MSFFVVVRHEACASRRACHIGCSASAGHAPQNTATVGTQLLVESPQTRRLDVMHTPRNAQHTSLRTTAARHLSDAGTCLTLTACQACVVLACRLSRCASEELKVRQLPLQSAQITWTLRTLQATIIASLAVRLATSANLLQETCPGHGRWMLHHCSYRGASLR